MLKELFDKGKCLVGIHQGDWSFVKEKDCTRIRICVKCATESRKVEHNLGEWAYLNDGACDQQQTCSRCDLVEHREVHEWQEPQRRSDDTCEQVIVCGRCQAEKEAASSHLWGEWEYVKPDACGQIQTCKRCGSPGAKRTEHVWGEWHHSEKHGGEVHVCSRCDELAVSTATQILKIISALISQQSTAPQSTAPRQIAAPAAQGETASEGRGALDAQARELMAAMTAQYEKIQAQMNALEADAASLSPAEARMKAELAEQLEVIKLQMNKLQSQYAAHAEAAPAKGAQRAAASVERDPRLIGHWQCYVADPFGGTDYNRMLKADGGFVDNSLQSNGRRSGPVTGEWRTGNQTLYLNYAKGRSIQFKYQLDGNRLFFPGAEVQRLWERVR
ncbi:MAG: hypothetical protein LC803_22000 [Acidobacteria bacterium]|nr:hypothetical protein [Acidobacteriota bacterium]